MEEQASRLVTQSWTAVTASRDDAGRVTAQVVELRECTEISGAPLNVLHGVIFFWLYAQ